MTAGLQAAASPVAVARWGIISVVAISANHSFLFMGPVLHGEAAARFVEAADEALQKRGSIDFSKQLAKARAILKRSKLYI